MIIWVIFSAKRETALSEISKLKERELQNLAENTKLQATLNQLEKVEFFFYNKFMNHNFQNFI